MTSEHCSETDNLAAIVGHLGAAAHTLMGEATAAWAESMPGIFVEHEGDALAPSFSLQVDANEVTFRYDGSKSCAVPLSAFLDLVYPPKKQA